MAGRWNPDTGNTRYSKDGSADKREWATTKVKKEMSVNERWSGIRLLKEDYMPKLYALRGRFGKPVMLGQRAQATAEYLQEEQWQCKVDPKMLDISHAVLNDLRRKKFQEEKPQIVDGCLTEAEFKIIIKRLARDKAPGPHNFTTDWLKDLDESNRAYLLELLNSWWKDGPLPAEMSEAPVASLFKKGEPNK